jgi:signal transduction histidine kinase
LPGPRITTASVPAAFERLATLRAVRYTVPLVTVGVVAVISWGLGATAEKYTHLFLFFTAILVANVTAGFGPGIIATALSFGLLYKWPLNGLNLSELIFLGAQGILVSLVGGALRSIKMKARERLAANLNLEQQLLEVGDDERRRIGHDLHDGLGQHLTGISLLSESMAQQLESGGAPDRHNVERITHLVSEAVRITRDLAKTLSPVTLERDGFIAAIEELSETASALLNIDCDWEFDGQDLPLDRTRALHLFRIVQEAVNNSVRHGKAQKVRIALSRNGSELTVRVTDNGSGLSQKTIVRPGLGLRIMQYRARMLGANLAVERASDIGGTVVTCTCPIDANPPPN